MKPSAPLSLRLLPVLLAAAAAACDSPSEGNRDPEAVAVVSGDLQTATVGQALAQDFVVRVTDGRDRPVEGAAVSFVVTAGGGTLSAASASTDAAGTARTRLTLGTMAGDTQRVEARVTGEDGPVTASFRAVGTAAAPAAVAAQGSANVTGPAGAAVDSLTVRVTDAFGNPTSGVAVVFSVVSGGGTISPSTVTTNAAGLAKASWTLGLRVDSLQRAEAAISPATRVQFTATATLPLGTRVVKTGGDLQADSVGSTLAAALGVRVETSTSVPIVGAPVTWAPAAGSGTATPPASTTDAAGLASTSWTVGTVPGTHSLTATATGTGATATFSATVGAGQPAAVSIVSGNNQTGERGEYLADSLVVALRDRYGNLLAGRGGTTFAVVSGGGSVSPASPLTDAQGRARTRWRLGSGTGEQRVRASVAAGAAVDLVATASTVDIGVVVPGEGDRVGDTLLIGAFINSPALLDSAYARLADRQVNLVLHSSGQMRGTLIFTGLPSGPYSLIVRARDVTGATAEDTVPVLLDRRPRLSVSLPLQNTVASTTTRVTAACIDDFPGCTVTLAAPSLTATGTLDATIDLASFNHSRAILSLTARDNGGRITPAQQVVVFVQSSPRWTELAQVGFLARDASPSFVVARDSSPADSVFLHNVAAGTTHVVAGNGNSARVTPFGAVFSAGSSVYDWRGGTPTLLGPGSVGDAEGNYVVGQTAGATGLIRYDLTTGTSLSIPGLDAGSRGVSVAANGDVAWSDGTEVRWRHADGTVEVMPRAAGWRNEAPETDGTQVVYTTLPPSGTNTRPRVVVYRSPGVTWSFEGRAFPGEDPTGQFYAADYDANGGWALVRYTPAGETDGCFTIAPDGTERRATPGATSATCRGVSSDGSVLFGSQFVARAPYTGVPVNVETNGSATLFWRGTTLLGVLGRGAYVISY